MSVQGPLARTMADVRLALLAMSAGDARDPWWVPAPLTGPPLPRPLRVAMTVCCQGTPADPAVVAAVRQAGAWLADAGYVVEEVEPPSLAEAARTVEPDGARRGAEASCGQPSRPWRRRRAALVRLDARATPGAGPPKATPAALARGHHAAAALAAVPGAYPLVLCPVSGEPPFPWGMDVDSETTMARVLRAQESQFAVPVLGLPAVSVPTGMAGRRCRWACRSSARASAKTWCWTPPR
jgi:amidase